MPPVIEIEIYETPEGERPFEKWFERIDYRARDRIRVAFARLQEGNIGNLKSVGGGVSELKIPFGPGYRVYLGQDGPRLVILLHGGTKRRQSEDIAAAKALWRTHIAERRN